jgi:hypothetical protein
MEAFCTLTTLPNNVWRIRHSSSALGEVELTGSSREEALARMEKELQYRMELCPCTGESVGTLKLQVRQDIPQNQDH